MEPVDVQRIKYEEAGTKEAEFLTAYKYLLTDAGVLFVLDADYLPEPNEGSSLNVAKGPEGTAFLCLGRKIYALLEEVVVEHLKRLLKDKQEITISFAASTAEEYEIRVGFSLTLDQVNCATLISLYRIAKGS